MGCSPCRFFFFHEVPAAEADAPLPQPVRGGHMYNIQHRVKFSRSLKPRSTLRREKSASSSKIIFGVAPDINKDRNNKHDVRKKQEEGRRKDAGPAAALVAGGSSCCWWCLGTVPTASLLQVVGPTHIIRCA